MSDAEGAVSATGATELVGVIIIEDIGEGRLSIKFFSYIINLGIGFSLVLGTVGVASVFSLFLAFLRAWNESIKLLLAFWNSV